MKKMLIRRAAEKDLLFILELYNELNQAYDQDHSGNCRDYYALWRQIDSEPLHHILVAERAGLVTGTATVIIIPNLGHGGRPWSALENVVVAESLRGLGIGRALITEAVNLSREHNCYKMSLTSNLSRHVAHEFYRQLGMQTSHVGFTLDLAPVNSPQLHCGCKYPKEHPPSIPNAL